MLPAYLSILHENSNAFPSHACLFGIKALRLAQTGKTCPEELLSASIEIPLLEAHHPPLHCARVFSHLLVHTHGYLFYVLVHNPVLLLFTLLLKLFLL